MKEYLRRNPIARAINDLPFLQRKLYQGTSGVGVCGKNLKTYLNIFNGYSFFENDPNEYEFSLKLNYRGKIVEKSFALGHLQSKIVLLNDFFEFDYSRAYECVGFRVTHQLPNPDFVPYCFVNVIGEEHSSTVHSSSFGNCAFPEFSTHGTENVFAPEFLNRMNFILMTLYEYSQATENFYSIEFVNSESGLTEATLKEKFNGQICELDLSKATAQLDSGSRYRLVIKGPAHANPYALINHAVLMHL